MILTIVLAGCGASPLCSTCPDVGGSYALSFDTPPASDACDALHIEVQNGPLSVTQVGSSVHGTFAQVALDGTLSADDQLSLAGAGNTASDGGAEVDSYSLFGQFESLAGADGGSAQIVGTFSGQFQRTVSGQPQSCSVSGNFTARR